MGVFDEAMTSACIAAPASMHVDRGARKYRLAPSSRNRADVPVTLASFVIAPVSVPKVFTHPGFSQLCVRFTKPLPSTIESVFPAAVTYKILFRQSRYSSSVQRRSNVVRSVRVETNVLL